jgi:hypothetical protein
MTLNCERAGGAKFVSPALQRGVGDNRCAKPCRGGAGFERARLAGVPGDRSSSLGWL